MHPAERATASHEAGATWLTLPRISPRISHRAATRASNPHTRLPAACASIAALLLGGMPEPAAAGFEPSPCFLDDCSDVPADGSIVFGRLQVPESRERSDGRHLQLAVVVLKATGEQPRPDPVVYLPGGPGVGGMERIETFAENPLRAERDIVLMDFRGVGYSDPALCPELGEEFWTLLAQGITAEEMTRSKVERFLACRETLVAAGVELGAYHSAAIVDDLEALREALGVSTWNLHGVSYGTRIALTYLRDHPGAVRSVVLDSAVPLGTRHMLEVVSGYERALERYFAACTDDPVCREVHPRLAERFEEVSRGLETQPLVVPMAPDSGLPGDVFTVNFHDMHLAFHQLLYDRTSYPVLPLLLDTFAERDIIALGHLLGRFARRLQRFSFGHFILVNRHDNGIYLGDPMPGDQDLARGLSYLVADITAAREWQSPMGGDEEMVPVRSDVPVLILAGEMDPITPPSYGEITGSSLTNAHVLRFPAVGHSVGFSASCPRAIAATFIEQPDRAPDPGCIERMPPIEFVGEVYRNSRVASFALAALQEQRPGLLIPLALALLAIVTFLLVRALARIARVAARLARMLDRAPGPASPLASPPESPSESPARGWTMLAHGVLGVNSLVALVLLTGLVHLIALTVERNGYLLLFGLVADARWFLGLSYPFLLGTAICGWLAWRAWRRSWWRTWARVHYSLATLGCAVVAGVILMYRLWP